jgi:hypothetical protein
MNQLSDEINVRELYGIIYKDSGSNAILSMSELTKGFSQSPNTFGNHVVLGSFSKSCVSVTSCPYATIISHGFLLRRIHVRSPSTCTYQEAGVGDFSFPPAISSFNTTTHLVSLVRCRASLIG